jgi:hypothetical protein
MIIFREMLKNPRYVFLQVGELGIKIELSDDLEEFKYFNHYGFIPELKDMEILKRKGVVGWTGNDTWYYIMQHDTWRYMNLDLRIEVGKAVIEKLAESVKINNKLGNRKSPS